jgi:hypothetical protein
VTVIHETYLPFSAELLGQKHFAPVASGGNPKAQTRYYIESAARAAAYATTAPAGTPAQIAKATSNALQMQKDERFWIVAALMKIFYSADKPQEPLAALLARALGDTPPFPGCATWIEALGDDPRLYFEVNLPSPLKYKGG